MKKVIYSSLFAMLLLGFCSIKATAQEDKTVYNFVSMETPPTYPGGMVSLYKYLGENIKYPQQAKDENVQGNVYVSFTVEKDGSLNDIKVDRKLGAGTDEEAIRVLKESKKWNPGIQNGKVVRVKYNIPIKFSIPGKEAARRPMNAPTAPKQVSASDTTIYSFVAVQNPPKFVGGIAEFYTFLGNNIKYPTEAKENKIQGNVFASFVVEKDGSLSNIKIDRKLGAGTDEEAVRVLGLSPKWEPGNIAGTPIRVKYNIPIKFSLNKNEPKN
ncbi:MAG: energy transducer TonB [Pedobacter sp.]|nr:MAG: energy transducer TonB [Pedobacter sp.]